MKLLLDTHALYWWTVSPEKLSGAMIKLLEDADNILYVSVATLWELQIKVQIGKMGYHTLSRTI